MGRMVRRMLAVVAVAVLGGGLWAAQASAHVTINTLGVVTQACSPSSASACPTSATMPAR